MMKSKKIMNLYGEKCSTIISRVTSQMEQLNPGDSIIVKTDNICACKKIPAWCREKNYPINMKRIDKNCMDFTIRVQ